VQGQIATLLTFEQSQHSQASESTFPLFFCFVFVLLITCWRGWLRRSAALPRPAIEEGQPAII
jgi:hypothetical protein